MRYFTAVISILLISGFLHTSAAPENFPTLENSLPARVIASKLPDIHLAGKPFDNHIVTNALHIFLTTLDFNRIYFLRSDIDKFNKQAVGLETKIKNGDITLAKEIVDIFINRVSNRVDYVEKILNKELDLTGNQTFKWQRDDEDWPADKDAWNDLWRQKIKNEYIARLVADKITEEEKENNSEEDNSEENKKEDSEEIVDLDLLLEPEEFILKKYRQFLIVMQDNDDDWIQQTYLTAFMQAFDPHSQYLSPNTMKNFQISMKLSLVGIGAVLRSEDGAAKVVELIPGGAAESDKRLKPGDKIIAVAQSNDPPVSIMHMPLDKAVMLIRGEKGTKVVLHVVPASDPSGSNVRQIALIRDEVKLEEQKVKSSIDTIKTSEGAERKLGIIKVPAFYAEAGFSTEDSGEPVSCSADVAQALKTMADEKVEGIVLDLRNNGGGSLKEAVDMTGLFIKTGPVVQLKDKTGVTIFMDTDPAIVYEGPIAVLVNRQSASASEIVAGALQDYGRAIIIGDSKTHGKGTVQSMIDMEQEWPGFGAFKITTACFYRIAGDSTQIKGIAPDIILPSMLDNLEIGEEHLPNALIFSPVTTADFQKRNYLSSVIPALEKKSQERRSNDPDFLSYNKLRENIATRINDNNISLNLEQRIAEAREQKQADKYTNETEDKSFTEDIILKESMAILADLITMKKEHQTAKQSDIAGRTAE